MTSAINIRLNLHIWRQKLIINLEKGNVWDTAASDCIGAPYKVANECTRQTYILKKRPFICCALPLFVVCVIYIAPTLTPLGNN